MDSLRLIFLAFVQGVTEFIPVSSSGHLVFFQEVLGFKEPLLLFDVLLHVSTMLSIIVFLRKEIREIIAGLIAAGKALRSGSSWSNLWRDYEAVRISGYIVSAFIPAALIGIILHKLIETMFASLFAVGISFGLTGTVLFFTRFAGERKENKSMGLLDALVIGIAQAVAIVPGVSRSGMTIAAGLSRGLDKSFAARFSFLLAIPTILGAAVFTLKDGIGTLELDFLTLAVSCATAFIAGYGALAWLSRAVAGAKFHYFSYYCWLMGIISIVLSVGLKK